NLGPKSDKLFAFHADAPRRNNVRVAIASKGLETGQWIYLSIYHWESVVVLLLWVLSPNEQLHTAMAESITTLDLEDIRNNLPTPSFDRNHGCYFNLSKPQLDHHSHPYDSQHLGSSFYGPRQLEEGSNFMDSNVLFAMDSATEGYDHSSNPLSVGQTSQESSRKSDSYNLDLDPELERILETDPSCLKDIKSKSFQFGSNVNRKASEFEDTDSFAAQDLLFTPHWSSLSQETPEPPSDGFPTVPTAKPYRSISNHHGDKIVKHPNVVESVRVRALLDQRPPSFKELTLTSRTQARQMLDRELCLQQPGRELSSQSCQEKTSDSRPRGQASHRQNQDGEENGLSRAIPGSHSIGPHGSKSDHGTDEVVGQVPPNVFKVQTRLQNPTKYHMQESQKRQVREYLAYSPKANANLLRPPNVNHHAFSAPDQSVDCMETCLSRPLYGPSSAPARPCDGSDSSINNQLGQEPSSSQYSDSTQPEFQRLMILYSNSFYSVRHNKGSENGGVVMASLLGGLV
ncbi:hypothetical protein TCAL_10012, partial [Tigriopus californicus]